MQRNLEVRSDHRQWWNLFIEQCNGISKLWDIHSKNPELRVISDASGSWSCGAIWQNEWCQLPCDARFKDEDIGVKELIPVVVAAVVWGHNWWGKTVEYMLDNEAVVAVLNSGYARDKSLMHLLRCSFFMAAALNFWYCGSHIPGRLNTAADAILRNKKSVLFEVIPSINSSPSTIPQRLIELVAPGSPNWISPSWVKRFRDSIRWH